MAKKILKVVVSTVADVAENKPGVVVWTGTDSEAARLRRISEEQAGKVAWVE